MKIKGLDGKEYSWNPASGKAAIGEVSSYHLLARKVIRSIYKSEPVLEEVSLPGTKPTLFADFIIPLRSVIVEVHGEQHYEQVSHFQPQRRDFVAGQKRDLKKQAWCQINGFDYIELPFWETELEWRQRIIRGCTTEDQ